MILTIGLSFLQFDVASSAQTAPVGRGKHPHRDRSHGDGHRAAVEVFVNGKKEGRDEEGYSSICARREAKMQSAAVTV